jgi:hypothetical protein
MSYTRKGTLTVDHTQCGSSDSSNFAVRVLITDATLKLVGNGGAIQNTVSSNGQTVPADLCFFSDAGLTTPISNFEIESHDGTAGTILAWVKIPTVSHTSDTVFYMGYGDASVVTFQGNVNATWDGNFVGVWHFADGTTLGLKDSTSNALHGTNHDATAATGQQGGGVNFDGTDDYVDIGSSTGAADNLSTMTVTCWLKAPTTFGGNFSQLVGKINDTNTAAGWSFILKGTGSGHPGKLTFFAQESGGSVFSQGYSQVTFNDNAWHKATLVKNGAGFANMTLYVDGSSSAMDDVSAGSASSFSNAVDIQFGNMVGLESYATVTLDEVRISSVVRSADWDLQEYNNQKAGSTFLGVSLAANGAAPRFLLVHP